MENKQYFEYGDKETTFLMLKDLALGKAMDEIGHVYREVIPDMFLALINSIIRQQISTKAQETIWLRFLDLFTPVTPWNIASLPVETIQSCGISMKKALYIHEIAASILDGRGMRTKTWTRREQEVVHVFLRRTNEGCSALHRV